GFVFRTDHLQDLHWRMPGPKEQYYIKRLVGVPGDTLEIREPILYRNGQPITGAAAFQKNAERQGNYPGYRNTGPDGRMEPGESLTVPADSFMAFGDNSASSLDSRYWGAIPEADVVGRPLFIYYPFTRRWGPARQSRGRRASQRTRASRPGSISNRIPSLRNSITASPSE